MKKRVIALILGIFALFSFFGCQKKESKPMKTDYTTGKEDEDLSGHCDGGYIYYIGSDRLVTDTGVLKAETLWRYNVARDTKEPACRDAACSHKPGSGCPFEAASLSSREDNFGGISSFAVRDGVVYYIATELVDGGVPFFDARSRICSYDTKTYKYKELCDYERLKGITMLQVYEDGVYYMQEIPHENDNGFSYWLYRYSFKKEKSEQLLCFYDSHNSADGLVIPCGIYREKALFYRESYNAERECKELHFLSYELHDPAPTASPVCPPIEIDSGLSRFDKQGNYVYTARKQENGSYSIWRLDLMSGEYIEYLQNTAYGMRVTKDVLYYFPYEPTFVDIGETTVSYNSVGKIIAKDLETGEETLYQSKEPLSFTHGSNYLYYYEGKMFTIVGPASAEQYNAYGWQIPLAYDLESDSYLEISLNLLGI